MTRSKFSTKAVLLAGGIGLSIAAFAGSQPAAAQSYSDEYTCRAGYVYDPVTATLCRVTLRACQEITESTFERVGYGFTTCTSHHML